MATVLEGKKAAEMSDEFSQDPKDILPERYDDEQDGLFMDVPPEKKRGIAAQGDSTYEIIPRRIDEHFHQAYLGQG